MYWWELNKKNIEEEIRKKADEGDNFCTRCEVLKLSCEFLDDPELCKEKTKEVLSKKLSPEEYEKIIYDKYGDKAEEAVGNANRIVGRVLGYTDKEIEELENTELVPQYDEYSYDKLMNLVKEHNKVMLMVTSDACPDCRKYESTMNEAREREPSIKLGTLSLDEKNKEARKLAKTLDIKTVPHVIVYKDGKERRRIIPKLERKKDIEDLIKAWRD